MVPGPDTAGPMPKLREMRKFCSTQERHSPAKMRIFSVISSSLPVARKRMAARSVLIHSAQPCKSAPRANS
ncbi:hypothetical protein D3C75_1067560 [compost metagenome]